MTVVNDTSYEVQHEGKKLSTFIRVMRMENEIRLVFEPFITIKNCLPMKIEIGLLIENEKKDAAEAELNYQEEFQSHSSKLTSKVLMQLKVPGFLGSDYIILSNPTPQTSNTQNNYVPEYLPIQDYRGLELKLSVKVEVRPFGSKRFFIYSQCIVISQIPNDLYYFCKNGDRISISPGQKVQDIPQTEYLSSLGKMSLFQSNTSLMLSTSEKGTKLSKQLNLTGIGNETIEVDTINDDIFLIQILIKKISADVRLKEVDQELKIFSKLVELAPKYIIVNSTQYTLLIMQESSKSDYITVKPQERKPLTWSDQTKEKNYNVLVQDYDSNQSYGWSGTLNIVQSLINFSVRNPKNFQDDVKYLKASIKQQKSYFFLQFIELKKNTNPSYIIENKMKDTNLIVYQGCFFKQDDKQYKENKYIIKSGEALNYAQDLPLQKNNLAIEFKFINERGNNLYIQEPLMVDLDCPEYDNLFIVPSTDIDNTKIIKFFIEIQLEGSVKRVRLIEEEEKTLKMQNQKLPCVEWQVQLSLPTIGLSMIGQIGGQIKEIIYLNLSQIELAFIETTKLRTLQVKIQNIQLDNNLSVQTTYPVILASSKQKSKIPHLSFIVEQDITVQQIIKLQSLRLAIQPTTLKLTDELLSSLLNFIEQFASPIIDSNCIQNYTSKDYESISLTDEQYQQNKIDFSWTKAPLQNKQDLMCIQEMDLYPLVLDLSFKKIRENVAKEKRDILSNVLKAIGVVFANVDGASLKLRGIKYINIMETSDTIMERLTVHYKSSLLKQTLQILGSVNIIGNPASLFKNIGSGVFDLIEMPVDGFIKGPIEGGVGVVKGAGSLIKNTVSGTFGSVQGITDSIGTGFSQLSMDKEFIRKRDKLKNKKAKHVGQGVKQGLQSLFTGIGEGITGLVTKPFEGAEKGGATGFFKGITKGIVGLVAKPITGVIDAASKTAEGIKNTATYFDDKAVESRARIPRVFYSREQYFQDYLEQDAQVFNMLQTFKKGKYANIQLVESLIINSKNEYLALVLSIQYVMLFNLAKKQLIFQIPSSQIYVVNQSQDGLVIHLIQASSDYPDKKVNISVDNPGERTQIIKKLNYLQEQCQ